jgi:hypothetical protein
VTLPVESAAFSLAHASRSLHSWLMSETSLPSSSSQSARYFSTSALAFANCAFASSTGEAFSVVALSIASISSLKMGRDFVLLECKANRIDPYPQVVSLFFQFCYYCLRLRHVAASRNACQATLARVLRLYGANGRRLKTAYDTVGQD